MRYICNNIKRLLPPWITRQNTHEQGFDTRLKQRDEKYYTRYNQGMKKKTKSILIKRDNQWNNWDNSTLENQ